MEELLDEFIAETSETLESLASELVIWENDPADKERLDTIFRFFHTIKGSCGFLNLPRFERLSHAAEDVLDDLRDATRDPSPQLVSAILAIVDRIAELIAHMESGYGLPDGEDAVLINALCVTIDSDTIVDQSRAEQSGAMPANSGSPAGQNCSNAAQTPSKGSEQAGDEAAYSIAENAGHNDIARLDILAIALEDADVDADADADAANDDQALIDDGEDDELYATDIDCANAECIGRYCTDKDCTHHHKLGSVPGSSRVRPVRSIRVPLELIDHMMSGVSDMVLARNEVARCLREQANDPAIESAFERLSTCIADMRDSIGQTRMQRINRIFSPLPRIVRDLAMDLGKRVGLNSTGNNVELDREMIEMIRDPLTHIIRNSIDHGIESPQIRKAKGKPIEGKLSIAARQSGNQILIEVFDDGQGIDVDKLINKAVNAKIITLAEASQLSEKAKLELIFSPGLSTADKVTSVSGRGVGMDVVRSNVERIGGSIDLENNKNQGLKVTLRVPLTLTIIPCLTVRAGGQEFAMPRSAIREIVFEQNEQVRIERVGGTEIAYIRGQYLPYVRLEDVLGLEICDKSKFVQRTIVNVTASSELQYALNVEAVIDHEELVVRPGAPVIMSEGIYAGTTLPDNGRPMLLLDPLGLALKAGLNEQINNGLIKNMGQQDELYQLEETESALLFIDRQQRRRAICLGVVERVEDLEREAFAIVAGHARANIEGDSHLIYGLDQLPEEPLVKTLRLTDGIAHLHYAIEDIIDIIDLPKGVKAAKNPGIIAGVCVYDDKQVEVIDTHWLFAEAGEEDDESDLSERPLCYLSGLEDKWSANILAPLVRSAGYRVQIVDNAENLSGLEDQSLVITGKNIVDIDERMSGKYLRLRNEKQPDSPADDSIYRYDRFALMNILKREFDERRAG